MPEIVVIPGSNVLSAKLTFDLGPYCQSCADLRKHRNVLHEAVRSDRTPTQIKQAESSLAQAQAAHFEERQKIAVQLNSSDVRIGQGFYLWPKIKRIIASQCDLSDPVQKELASQLENSAPSTPAFHGSICLEEGFIELFKNSVDAFIKQYMEHGSSTTILEANISFVINPNEIEIHYCDNAGGISLNVEQAFASNIANKEFRQLTWESEKNQDPDDPKKYYNSDDHDRYYFGGAGMGMAVLANLLLDGNRFDERCTIKAYEGTEGKTSLSMTNNQQNNGIQIIIASPIQPFNPYAPVKAASALKLGGSLFKKRTDKKNPPLAQDVSTECSQQSNSFFKTTIPTARGAKDMLKPSIPVAKTDQLFLTACSSRTLSRKPSRSVLDDAPAQFFTRVS